MVFSPMINAGFHANMNQRIPDGISSVCTTILVYHEVQQVLLFVTAEVVADQLELYALWRHVQHTAVHWVQGLP